MELLEELQAWYASQCDGDWEHNRGITIQSCDNPGWLVKIDIVGTAQHARSFTPIAQSVNLDRFPVGPRWLCCYVQDGVWYGAGDETKLPVILRRFLEWASSETN